MSYCVAQDSGSSYPWSQRKGMHTPHGTVSSTIVSVATVVTICGSTERGSCWQKQRGSSWQKQLAVAGKKDNHLAKTWEGLV